MESRSVRRSDGAPVATCVAALALPALLCWCNAILGNDPIVVWDAASGDSGAPPPSCAAGGAGMTNCGAGSGSCCASLAVPASTYDRTYDPESTDGAVSVGPDGAATALGDSVTVSAFRLDEYEVTVGRFRAFVAAWDGGAGWTPEGGSGKHSYLNGAAGLANGGDPGTYEPGWSPSDDSEIAPTDDHLCCDGCGPGGDATWTPSPGADESRPINCVSWWEAYAFCIWDGGFLPSEAEWELAAAGGDQQREYPWGAASPGSAYAIFGNGQGDCDYPGGSLAACTGVANIAPVGSTTLGAGAWGQLDLAGNLWEWTLDWYAPYVDPCVDCEYATPASDRSVRGGDFYLGVSYLHPSYRGSNPPSYRGNDVGFRCARAPLP